MALLLPAAPAAAQEACKLIVHPNNSATQIQREAVVAIFKGQMVRWKDTTPINPVDQSVRAPARVAFSAQVLKESVLAVQNHWMRQLQQGKVPPPVKGSDGEVAAYVKANRGAIGYVSEAFAVDDSVKVLKVVD
jgi:ABC-type phosphate transport system substrate-binding protein